MKAIVTGGAGFIGSHLVDALIERGDEVHIIDNLSSGSLTHIHPDAVFHRLDIRTAEVQNLFQRIKPQVVFHHAAQVDVQTSIHDPFEDANINVGGTIQLLEACRKSDVGKIIYASSCAVYGDQDHSELNEDSSIQPLSFYGISKGVPEFYIRAYSEMYDLPYTIFRYSNVYGPRQTPKGEGGVISIFVKRIQQGLPLTIYGDGEQTRDFVYVKDVVNANLAAVQAGNGHCIHVSTSNSTTVNGLAGLLQQIHGEPIACEYLPERLGEIRHSCLSNIKAKSILNWQPVYSLEEGLTATYQFAKAQN